MKNSDTRKQSIVDLLIKENRIYVSDLSHIHEVSEVTIRKDLKELEDRGLLVRIHGGAAHPTKSAVEPHLGVLMMTHSDEKKKIAAIAYNYISDGDSVLLDAATTTRELAHLLRDGTKKDITIITTAIEVTMELAPCEHLQVIQVGGMVRRSLVTTMGPMATAELKNLHVDKAFIGVNGVDTNVGLTTQNLLECEIKRQIIESSTQAFVLTDSSKMRCVALGVIAPLGRIDYIITDSGISPLFRKSIEECRVEVIIAE